MPGIRRVRVTFSGGAVTGPAVSTFHFSETAAGFQAALSDFWDGIRNVFPPSLTITVPAIGETINVVTGQPDGVWSDGSHTVLNGTGAATPYAQGVGARAVWHTLGYRNGRRVRGSTFLIPLLGGAYQDDGTIATAVLTVLRDEASALVTATSDDFLVYSRPRDDEDGAISAVVSGTVPDTPSWLRSRRT